MSWAYPRHPFLDGAVLDVDAFNETVARYAWEVNSLTEANFASDSLNELQDGGHVANDAAMSIFVSRPSALGRDPFTTAHRVDLTKSVAWERVPGMSKTFDSRGGMALILASFQISNNANALHPGSMFCIGLDDVPRLESLLGGGDASNDTRSRPVLRYGFPTDPGTSNEPPGAPTAPSANYRGTGPAFKSGQLALCTHLLTYLPPGRHIVDLRSKNVYMDAADFSQVMSQRQIFVFDLWADPR